MLNEDGPMAINHKVMVAAERPSPNTVYFKITGEVILTPQQLLDAIADYLLIDPKELFHTHKTIPNDSYDLT